MNTLKIFAKKLNQQMRIHDLNQMDISQKIGVSKATVSGWCRGEKFPRIDKIEKLALLFGVEKSELIEETKVTPDFAAFPILGDVAAGYDRYAVEDWDGPLVRIPIEDLHGRPASDFFALRVSGNSMFPQYVDGDLVLVLRQATLNRSGDTGVLLYNDDDVTIKKVEYVMGEDWLRLIPINPNYEPILIENEALEHCRVLGIPWMLIRYLEE